MMIRFINCLLLSFLITLSSFGQNKTSLEDYILLYQEIARKEMQKSGIPASIKLAQGILESGFGNSELSKNANNHFGIKCHTGWTGKSYQKDDDAKDECFRVYKNPEESYLDHTHFLTSRPRYANLFKLQPTDYKAWAHGLKEAGYATNPRYAHILIDLIEKHSLHEYDKPGGKEGKPFDSHKHVGKDPLPALDSRTIIDAKNSDFVFIYNHLKTVRIAENDDLRSIARKHNIPANTLATFNDMHVNSEVKPGSILYLQPKKNKAKQEKHLVIGNETMQEISQLYGVKLNPLLKRNLLIVGQEPAKGETILLRKNAVKSPSIRKKEIIPVVPMEEKKEEIVKEIPKIIEEKPKVLEEKKPSIAETKEPLIAVEEKKEVVIEIEKLTPEVDSSTITHTVEHGDTLYNLSRKYSVTVKELVEKNGIEDNTIKIGQTLIIK